VPILYHGFTPLHTTYPEHQSVSALEKFSLNPFPARHALRALPAAAAAGQQNAEPIEALIRLAERFIPAAVFVLDHGQHPDGLLSWPPGMMGRRAAIDSLARAVLAQCAPDAELWVADLAGDSALGAMQPVRDAGPVGFARLPIAIAGAPASFAVIRERGEWTEEERAVLRDLARAVASDCERQRLVARAAEVDRLSARADESTPERRRPVQGHPADEIGSVGPLLSGVCHELNNPLTSIKSFAELLLLDARTEEDREALEIVQREAHRASRIVADLRMIARRSADGTTRRDLVDVNEVVRMVLRTRAQEFSVERIECLEDLAPDLPLVRGVRGQLEQVVSHLVSNALKAVERREGLRCVTLRTRRSGVRVSLSVGDSGRGIRPEHLARIFDPFWTSLPTGEGSGLGLSLVQSIVTDHGGEVTAESGQGRGSIFTVELPGADELPAELATVEEPPANHGLRVLVVDDEAPIRYSLTRYMERRGHEVDQAGDGAEALRMVDAAAADRGYDIVIADLRMPGIDGDRLLDCLRLRDDRLENRLILMTGEAGTPAVVRRLQESGIPVMSKPFELAEVAQIIEAQAGLLVEESRAAT
jgi:signal transduction histidine kinase/CheY-like chemotaxis protein